MKKILGIGNALVDVLIRIENDHFLDQQNLPKGSMQLVDYHFASQLHKATSELDRSFVSGGSAANTISGLSRMGVNTAFIGKVSNDEYGSAFSSDLQAHNVKTHLITDHGKLSGFCTAFISPDGERTFATHLGVASDLKPEDIPCDIFNDYDILHIEGYLLQNHALIEKAIQTAKEHNMEVSLDLASYNVVEENADFLHTLIEEYVDIVFANEEEAVALTKKSPEEALHVIAEKAKIAIVKIGSEGSWIMQEKQKEKIRPFVANCVDTTGAGDLYASGFLFGYANDYPLQHAGTIGSYLAAQIVEEIGPKFPAAKWDVILKNMEEL
ncbi:MAG: adenosine kinase [Bacteroidales bacterium]|jgi:sugar/nucleoside kinase (ribokinase family)|nr:adenosine kinase [Bacteroidales bacterium]